MKAYNGSLVVGLDDGWVLVYNVPELVGVTDEVSVPTTSLKTRRSSTTRRTQSFSEPVEVEDMPPNQIQQQQEEDLLVIQLATVWAVGVVLVAPAIAVTLYVRTRPPFKRRPQHNSRVRLLADN